MDKNPHLLTEKQKIDYINDFLNGYEQMLMKKIMTKKANRTKVSIKPLTATKSMFGAKREVRLTNGNKVMIFTIEAMPWLWEEGSVAIEIKLKSTQSLSIPRSKIKDEAYKVFQPKFDTITFLTNTDIIWYYVDVIELTPFDVSLLDNITSTLERIFK